MRRVSHPPPPAGMIDSKVSRDSTQMYSRWRMKDVVGRFSPIRPKLGLKGSLKRRRKDEGEETRGRIREVLSKIGLKSVAQKEMSQVLSMEALEDSVLNLTHTRTSNRSMKKNLKKKNSRKAHEAVETVEQSNSHKFFPGAVVMLRRLECPFLPK